MAAPANIQDAAGTFGLDLSVLRKTAGRAGHSAPSKEARSEICTLEAIVHNLARNRSSVKQSGNISSFNTRRIPTSLLEAERRRVTNLLRGGRSRTFNSTNALKADMYRCRAPASGCKILNRTDSLRALTPHSRSYRNLPDICFAFNIEMKSGIEILSYPPSRAGVFTPGFSTSGCSTESSLENRASCSVLDVM